MHPVPPGRVPAGRAPSERVPNERGQVTPLLAVVVVLAATVALVLGALVRDDLAAARAQQAADAAALAGVLEGRAGAARLAAANGGRLQAYVAHATDVEVRVEVGGRTARARARAVLAGP